MNRKLTGLVGAAFLGIWTQVPATGAALQQKSLADAADRVCVVELESPGGESIHIQNLCRNPMAVRINWGDGRLFDYCLNSNGDVRSVAKRTSTYHLTREQAILLCP